MAKSNLSTERICANYYHLAVLCCPYASIRMATAFTFNWYALVSGQTKRFGAILIKSGES